MVPGKAKQLLLIRKGTRLFITEVIYLQGTCFRGILRKEGLVAGLFSYGICLCLFVSTPAFSIKWKCLTNRCTGQVWLRLWESTLLLCPYPTPGLPMRLWAMGMAHLIFVTLWALPKHLRRPGPSLCSGTTSSPETYSELSQDQSQTLWHLSRDQKRLL